MSLDSGPDGTDLPAEGADRSADLDPSETHRSCRGNDGVRAVLACSDAATLVLDEQRRIVDLNEEAISLLGKTSMAECLGDRVGEAMGCLHAWKHARGCGFSESCSVCGALDAISCSRRSGRSAQAEWAPAYDPKERLAVADFRVKATPITLETRRLTVLVLRDIRAERQRDALERVFFHDLNNTLQALQGSCERQALRVPVCRSLLGSRPAGSGSPATDAGWPGRMGAEIRQCEQLHSRLTRLLERLGESVESHRQLLEAERGTARLSPAELQPAALLGQLAECFSDHEVAAGRWLEIGPAPDDRFVSDRALLLRVLVNMVKNALEATRPGGTVRVRYERQGGAPTFTVWNPGFMPQSVQLSLFRRSFTTKGAPGRGLGTYSMKLLGERYLRGTVAFSSEEGHGTTFSIRLPEKGL